jgi:hypothetical protein
MLLHGLEIKASNPNQKLDYYQPTQLGRFSYLDPPY